MDKETIISKLLDTLSRLGIKNSEGEIYLKLLEIGPATVTVLSKKTKIPRATTHRLTDKLLQKGIASQTFKSGSRVIVAEDPSMLEGILVNKEADLKNKLNEVINVRSSLSEFMQEISTLMPSSASKQVQFKYYEGRHGVRNVYKSIVKASKIYTFVNLNNVTQIFPENVALFKNAMNKNNDMRIWEIIEDSSTMRETIHNLHSNYYYKFIPKEVSFSNVDILIYDEAVALINLENLSAIVINSSTIVSTLKAVHNVMWKLLK